MSEKTIIIAEAGVNHNGNLNLAKKMIGIAKDCGADIVKFQTGNAEKIIAKNAPKAEYQKVTTGSSESQLEMVKKLSLPLESFAELKEYCDKKNIEFLSTPFDLESIDVLNEIGMKRWKIPSGEVNNLPYLLKIAETKKPVIMSTGMCDIEEIESAVKILKEHGTEDLSLLHCTTEYPAPINEVNLKAIDTMRKRFNLNVGYSDHTQGIEIPIAAVARGVDIIEKHFTISRDMEGPDHRASIEPDELKAMVSAIRNVELAIGDGEKRVTFSEQKNRVAARKSIVAKTNIKKGDVFSEANITTKRPATGISPMRWYEVIGLTAERDYEEDEFIEV